MAELNFPDYALRCIANWPKSNTERQHDEIICFVKCILTAPNPLSWSIVRWVEGYITSREADRITIDEFHEKIMTWVVEQ